MQMQIRNIMEDAVERSLKDVLANRARYGVGDVCTCERCQLDIIALALNRLPPRYVVSEKGEVYARALGLNTNQYEIDILHAILVAIKLVGLQPRH